MGFFRRKFLAYGVWTSRRTIIVTVLGVHHTRPLGTRRFWFFLFFFWPIFVIITLLRMNYVQTSRSREIITTLSSVRPSDRCVRNVGDRSDRGWLFPTTSDRSIGKNTDLWMWSGSGFDRDEFSLAPKTDFSFSSRVLFIYLCSIYGFPLWQLSND